MQDESRIPSLPVIVKEREDQPLPEDLPAYYLLSRDGLFLVRRHAFFESCVPASTCPPDLASNETYLRPRFPRIPQSYLERIVGFFGRVAERQGSEAAVLLAWDLREKAVRLLIPEQVATMARTWRGEAYPVGVRYQVPADMPSGWLPFGDVHSHVDGAAFASAIDEEDEVYRPGVHLVVGKIRREPPDFHVSAVVDGVRFALELSQVAEGYGRRDLDVPEDWLARVRLTTRSPYAWSAHPAPAAAPREGAIAPGSEGGANGRLAHDALPEGRLAAGPEGGRG